MSAQLTSIQKILQELGIDAYFRSQSEDRSLSTLGIEIQTGTNESNLLEICEISIPDSDLFLLQWFVQLPLAEPFSPADLIPEFQISEVMALCAELNQILPVGIFNVYQQQLCFRHIFTCEFVSVGQIEYLLQTIEGTIQKIQPMLQSVAIGTISSNDAIARIDDLFLDKDTIEGMEEATSIDAIDDIDTFTHASLQSSSHDDVKEIESPEKEEQRKPSVFSINDIASMSLNIEEEQSIDDWGDFGNETKSNDQDDGWDLSNDYVVFDEDSND